MFDKTEDIKHYIKIMYELVKEHNMNNYFFIDVEDNDEKICKDVLQEFLRDKNIKLCELKNDKDKLRELII